MSSARTGPGPALRNAMARTMSETYTTTFHTTSANTGGASRLMLAPPPMRSMSSPSRNAATMTMTPTHGRQLSARTVRGTAGWRGPMRSSTSCALRVR